MNINVVNRHTTNLNTLQGEVVDIMHSHRAPLGNPFYNDYTLTHEGKVAAFEGWLWGEFHKNGPASKELDRLCALLLQDITVNLVCVCTPKPCHGDVIKRCLEWMLKRTLKYTGVGARATPRHVLQLMIQIAHKLATMGYTLRSGAAKGADTAFERGATLKEIYLKEHATPEAMAIAKRYHDGWHHMQDWGHRLHGRNSFQVLGPELNDPSDFLVCWTPDGCLHHHNRSRQTGGTGTAISIASMYHVKVFNLNNPEHHTNWSKWVQGGKY